MDVRAYLDTLTPENRIQGEILIGDEVFVSGEFMWHKKAGDGIFMAEDPEAPAPPTGAQFSLRITQMDEEILLSEFSPCIAGTSGHDYHFQV